VRKISIVFKGKKFKLKKKTVNIKLQDTEMNILDLTKKKIDFISNFEGFGEIPELEGIILDNNRLTEIEMTPNLNNLKYLSLKNNRIHNVKSLEGLQNLIELDLTGNEITYISGLENLPNLQILRLGNNKIVQINNLEYLHNLEVLILDNNQIREIKNLESLINLSYLNLNDNDITEVKNLDDLQNLRRIYLRNNWITKLFPIHLQNIDMFDIYGNPLCVYLKTRFEKIDLKIIIEYSLDPEGLEKRLMVGMRNIHVPINVSGLTSVLPSNDNILYSTFCKVRSVFSYQPNMYLRGTKYVSEWISHVLITESGIAFTIPSKKKPLELKFFKWGDIVAVKHPPNVGISAVRILPKVVFYTFMLTHFKELESIQTFQNRLHYFPELCVSLHKWSRRPEKLQEIARLKEMQLYKGNTHEEKLEWIKTQYYDLGRTIQDIANDLDESMITVRKNLDEIENKDISKNEIDGHREGS